MVVQLVLTFAVQLAIGALGTLALAAAGFVNSLVLVVMVSFSTLGAAAGILAARAYGARDASGVARVTVTAEVLAFASAVAVCLPAALLAHPLLIALGAPGDVAKAGAEYLPLTVLSLPFMIHAAVTSSTFRSLGHARTPMVVSMLAVVVNGTVAYALLLGPGPFPEMGLVGAGLANLAAQVLRAGLLFWLLHRRTSLVPFAWRPALTAWKDTVPQLLGLTLPLAMTQLSWSGASFLYALLFGKLGTFALAASQVVFSLEGMFIVASYGLMAAATTLIGQAIGRGQPSDARQWTRTLQRLGFTTGLVFGGLFTASAFLLPTLYPNVGTQTLQIAFWGVLINAAFQVVKVRNMILGGGVLPSGGDARGVVMGDLIGPFVVGLPLAYLLAFPLGLGVWGLFWARIADEIVKASFFTWRLHRVRWEALQPPRTEPREQQAA